MQKYYFWKVVNVSKKNPFIPLPPVRKLPQREKRVVCSRVGIRFLNQDQDPDRLWSSSKTITLVSWAKSYQHQFHKNLSISAELIQIQIGSGSLRINHVLLDVKPKIPAAWLMSRSWIWIWIHKGTNNIISLKQQLKVIIKVSINV